jgi:hypothetical protein
MIDVVSSTIRFRSRLQLILWSEVRISALLQVMPPSTTTSSSKDTCDDDLSDRLCQADFDKDGLVVLVCEDLSDFCEDLSDSWEAVSDWSDL